MLAELKRLPKTHFPPLASCGACFIVEKFARFFWDEAHRRNVCCLERLHIDLRKCKGLPDTGCMPNYRESSKWLLFSFITAWFTLCVCVPPCFLFDIRVDVAPNSPLHQKYDEHR
jgi:hypothetical protein